MATGRIYYATRDGTCILRFEGEITGEFDAALGTFLDGLLSGGDYCDLIVDLSATEQLDPVCIDHLFRIARFVWRRDGSTPLLFTRRSWLDALLFESGLDEVFAIHDDAPGQAADETAARHHRVVVARRLLAEMNGPHRAMYQDIGHDAAPPAERQPSVE